MTTREFFCECCKQVCETDITEEEARAESRHMFGEIPKEEQASVCSPCFKRIMAWYKNSDKPEIN